jgi:hypothetical protein
MVSASCAQDLGNGGANAAATAVHRSIAFDTFFLRRTLRRPQTCSTSSILGQPGPAFRYPASHELIARGRSPRLLASMVRGAIWL